MSLLPTNHDEFRTKQYWDDFFVKRGDSAFEWYGSYNDISPSLSSYIKSTNTILNIGCGNSTFSVDCYNDGFKNITNLDFSEFVINEMKAKYADKEQMVWEVGDMTAMSNYSDNSFDVVFDKGGLDALMSVDSPEVQQKAQSMFDEISRVLIATGKYISVTLAEKFIIQKYMSYFSAASGGDSRWSINIHAVKSAMPSPFMPFLIVASKVATGSTPSAQHNTKLFVDHVGGVKTSADVESRAVVLEKLAQIQEFHRMKFQLGRLEVGRFEPVQLWSEASSDVPRFTIFVLDATERASLSCAVFMVPFGREAEYQFSTHDGLSDIAHQAGCRRLLAVCCNRPHSFPPMTELQAELSPIAMSLRLQDMDIARESIPFMAINEDNRWETIARGASPLSGAYVVEEALDEEHSNAVLRRLIFLQNQNFVQTEVRLTAGKTGKSAASKGGKKKGSGKANVSSGLPAFEFDYTSLDAHHRAALVSLVLVPSIINSASSVRANAPVDSAPSALLIGLGGGALPMCLQRYLPGLRLWVCDLDSQMESVATEHFGFKCNARTRVLTHEGLSLIEAILGHGNNGNSDRKASAAVAQESDKLKGLEGESQLDLLFIDADSKDPSLGMSAPPPAFVTLESLQNMHAVLRPGGVLLMNVVARAKPLLSALIDRINYVFQVNGSGASAGRVYSIQGSSETVNVGIVVVKGDNSNAGSGSGSGSTANSTVFTKQAVAAAVAAAKAERIAREKLLEKWLKDVGLSSDPLHLEELVGQLKNCAASADGSTTSGI